MSLAPIHLEDLRKSGLTDETIQLMGVSSVPPPEINRLSKSLKDVESLLEFPYPYVEPLFSRYKKFPTPADGSKYFQQAQTRNHLYILPPVKECLPDPTIKLSGIEGEKKTGLGVQMGLKAFGVPGVWSWLKKDSADLIEDFSSIALVNREIELIFDSDIWIREELQRALYAFGRVLESKGAKVSLVVIPGSNGTKNGIDDYVLVHGVEGFANLTRINLRNPAIRQHESWFENWLGKKIQSGEKRKGIILSDPEPWSQPVNGADLLKDLSRSIKRFIVSSNASHVAQALWILHTHCIDASPCSPFLTISAPVMESGKTRRLEVTEKLCPRPLWTSNTSPAALFRVIEKYKPTLLIDEADQFVDLSPELKGILNASHYRASAVTIRVVGENHEPTAFSTWSPKAIALIGQLPPTLSSRSIILPMARKKKSDAIDRFSPGRNYQDLEELRSKCARWAADNLEALNSMDPEMPEHLSDRTQDNWRPLLSIAELAGGKWPGWARLAALALNEKKDDSIGVELLKDIAPILEGLNQISSESLVKELNALSTRPWPDWNKGKSLSQRNLANILRGFGIRPKKIRIADKTLQGYENNQFAQAFDTYLADQTESDPEHTEQVNDFCELDDIFGPEQDSHVPGGKTTASTEKECVVPDVPDARQGDKSKPADWKEV